MPYRENRQYSPKSASSTAADTHSRRRSIAFTSDSANDAACLPPQPLQIRSTPCCCLVSLNGVNVGEIATPHLYLQPRQTTDVFFARVDRRPFLLYCDTDCGVSCLYHTLPCRTTDLPPCSKKGLPPLPSPQPASVSCLPPLPLLVQLTQHPAFHLFEWR